MSETYDLLLKGGTLVNQDGTGPRDVAIKAGRIAALGRIDASKAGQTIDCTGLHVLPGVIDSHVHFREPGSERKEDLESGSRAAVLGGVTATFEMPNTNPSTIDEATLADKVRRGRHRMHCDYAFWIGAAHSNAKDLGELERLPGAAGVKVFMGSSTGDLLVEDDPTLSLILRTIRRRPVFHSEDEPRLEARKHLRRAGDASSHPVWRDETAAIMATERLVGLARAAGRPIHVLHVSTAEEMEFLAGHRDIASVEVTPHHLLLSADDYARLGNLLQMNPPIRDKRHNPLLWQGVVNGTVDTIGSDHAPHLLEEKALPYPRSPSGMAGTQTLVPLMLDAVSRGAMTIERLADLTSAGPARLFGIAGKGRVARGYDADLTIVDLKRKETITNKWIASKCSWTPYDGTTVTGWPVGTIVRGSVVMREGELVTGSTGEPVRFAESLPRT